MIGKIIIVAVFLLNYGYVESGTNPLTIIGGNPTGIETYNFLVSVHYNGTHCGGSIISPTFLITAAHCVHNANPQNIRVRFGSSSPKEAGLLIGIAPPIYEHLHYEHETRMNDISLLRIRGTFTYGDCVGAIPLPIYEDMTYETATVLKVIGFGETETGRYTRTLKEANLQIENDTVCEQRLGIDFFSEICATYFDIKLRKRDEGSPVLYNNQLIGIVTRVVNEDEGELAVLVRVAEYLEFIAPIIRP